MDFSRKRDDGFYWVILRGDRIVAQYNYSEYMPPWANTIDDKRFFDDDFDEILGSVSYCKWTSVKDGYPKQKVTGERGRCVQVYDGDRVRVEWFDHMLANIGGSYIPIRGFESGSEILFWAELLDAPKE